MLYEYFVQKNKNKEVIPYMSNVICATALKTVTSTMVHHIRVSL